jgi:DNA primase
MDARKLSANVNAIKAYPVDRIIGYSTELKPLNEASTRLIGRCVFHQSVNAVETGEQPSLTVNRRLGIFKCHQCGVAGDGLEFVTRLEGLPFETVVRLISDRHGITVEGPTGLGGTY